jgi:uncharacterized protein DUF2721
VPVPESGPAAIAHAIQLAVAPVFLLTGIGAILSVLAGRLARIIDRARVLEAALATAPAPKQREIGEHLSSLLRRSRLVHGAISLATTSALLVCAVIAALFLAVFFSVDLSDEVGIVFVASMVALIVALILFLWEVHIAIGTTRIGPDKK